MGPQLSFVSVLICTRAPQILYLIHIHDPARKKENTQSRAWTHGMYIGHPASATGAQINFQPSHFFAILKAIETKRVAGCTSITLSANLAAASTVNAFHRPSQAIRMKLYHTTITLVHFVGCNIIIVSRISTHRSLSIMHNSQLGPHGHLLDI